MKIKTKRVYDKPDPGDGFRVLVDRLWPRGLSRADAKIDLWLKDIAPSNELRKWFNHDPDKWPGFKKKFFAELDANRDAVDDLLSRAGRGRVCFLYASKEQKLNNAAALKDYVESLSKPAR